MLGARTTPQITVDFKQAAALLEMFGGEAAEITLMAGPGHSGEGLYAVYNADPEGAVYLGQTDDDARPDEEPTTAAWGRCPVCGEDHMRYVRVAKDEPALIRCTNHSCRSNGGDMDIGAAALLRAVQTLPMVRANEIDGEESDGTPISWRNRPFVSLKALERLLAAPATAPAASPADEVERIVHLRTDRARRVYIAGPMTGLPGYNFDAFNAKAAELRAEGWHVENPAEHGHIDGAGWADYLRWDISRIATCGAIYLLPGWQASKGASLEVVIGKALGVQFLGVPLRDRIAALAGAEPVGFVRSEVLPNGLGERKTATLCREGLALPDGAPLFARTLDVAA